MAGIRLAYVNLFARDFVGLAHFYKDLFGFPEIVAHRSPIYRCLDAGGIELGFNADAAYDLLALADRRSPDSDWPMPVGCYFTVEVDSEATVEALASQCVALGGRICKAPYVTYYNSRQAVLADPEGNIFRVNHRLAAPVT